MSALEEGPHLLAQNSREASGQRRGRQAAQKGLIEVDGAALYSAPSFDSPIIEYLGAGSQLVISRKIYKGIGGFGLFYKAKTSSGKVGYLADTDLVPEYSASGSKKQRPKENPVFDEVKEQIENPNREPLYYTRYIGGTVGLLNFTEKFSGSNLSDQVTMFGLKMSGPGVLFDGPPIDFNFTFSPSAPGYYEKFSNGPANGFFVFTDALIQLPLIEINTNNVILYGFGLMTTYTRFKTTIGSQTFDSQEIRLGGVLSLGYGYRFGRNVLRWDSKYYYEKTAYVGHWLSFQREYR